MQDSKREICAWACALIAVLSIGTPAAAQAPAPAPASSCASPNISTPGITWVLIDFELSNLNTSALTPRQVSMLTQVTADKVWSSAQQATGIIGILRDDVSVGTTRVELAVQTSVAPTDAQLQALDAWLAATQGLSPEAVVSPLLGSLTAAGQAEQPTVVVDAVEVTHCLPAAFITLGKQVTAQPAAAAQVAPAGAAGSPAPPGAAGVAHGSTLGGAVNSPFTNFLNSSCTPSASPWLVVNYVLSGFEDLLKREPPPLVLRALGALGLNASDAELSQLVAIAVPAPGAAPAPAPAGWPRLEVGAGQLDDVWSQATALIRSMWLDTQRRLALHCASVATAPVGPMWANGAHASFALPLNSTMQDAVQAPSQPIKAYAGNISGVATMETYFVLPCLPDFYSSSNDLSGLAPYRTQDWCPIDAKGQLVVPPQTSTPLWYNAMNATVDEMLEGANASTRAQAPKDIQAEVELVLSDIKDASRTITTFTWPPYMFNGTMVVSGHVAMWRPPDQLTLNDAAQMVAALNDRQAPVFWWGNISYSNITFAPCSPLWFVWGYALAEAYRSAHPNAAPPPPAPPPPSGGGSFNMAAAVVPAVLGGLLVAAVVAGFGLRRRYKRRVAQLASRTKLSWKAGLEDGWLIPFQDIKLLERLGEGGYGQVYKAKWRDTRVAVKSFAMPAAALGVPAASVAAPSHGTAAGRQQQPDTDTTQGVVASLQKEAAIMSAIRHPNCIMYLGACLDPPCLVMELASKGSLLEVLHKSKDLPWLRRINMAYDAAKGMQYLHSRQPPIIHRDLKSGNLLVDGHWGVKVSDFGLSRVLQAKCVTTTSSLGGPGNPRWLAPEVLKGGDFEAASDAYAFGVILWELLAQGQLPWGNLGAWKIASLVTAGERPEIPLQEECPSLSCYDGYVQLTRECWAQDPQSRPTFDAICSRLRGMLAILMKDARAHTEQSLSAARTPSLTDRLRSLTHRGPHDSVEEVSAAAAVDGAASPAVQLRH